MLERFVAIVSVCLFLAAPAGAEPLTGTVVDSDGHPIEGARVRIAPVTGSLAPISPTTHATSDADGNFSTESPVSSRGTLYIGIGKPGYVNLAGNLQLSGTLDLGPLAIEALAPIDNVAYQWWKPFWPKDDQTDVGCNACHGEQAEAWGETLMAKSAIDPLVLSYYEGKDLDGEIAGEGYRLDNPDEPGPCANCHAPAASIDAPDETVLTEVEGVALEGVFCDVCHKVRDVVPDGGPGVAGSLLFHRPSAWAGLFAFGPFENISGPMGSSYNAVIGTSRFCAGCHEWTNDAGVPVLSTFSEWSEVSGADADALQCQDCHMKKKFGAEYRGEPEGEYEFLIDDPHVRQMHGVRRPVSTVYPHGFRGGLDLIQEAADVGLEVSQDGRTGELVVTATVENVNAGHALPTGMPFRHMMIVVEATVDGEPAAQVGGSTVPDYGGTGDADDDFGGRPGKGYARVLGDGAGGRNTPFWKATEVIEDTRIRGGESDTVVLRFAAPAEDANASVRARLVYRRAFIDMIRTKKWDVEDVVLADVTAATELTAVELEPDACVDGCGDSDAGVVDSPDSDDPAADDDSESTKTSDGCGCSFASSQPPIGAAGLLALLLVRVVTRRRRTRRCRDA